MAEIRFNYGDKFTQTTDTNTGIGSTIPAVKLDVAGGTSAGSLRVSGIATLSSYQGFVNTKLSTTENLIVEAGQSGSVSGEVVIGTGQTISVSTGATTGQGGVHSLKVYQTFMPPVGGTADRPTDVKPGMVYYNKDFKTIEFWDGNFWKQVDNTTASGRAALMGGGLSGYSSPVTSAITAFNIVVGGEETVFGELTSTQNASTGLGNRTRGICVRGQGSTPGAIEYVTMASLGNSITFGDLNTVAYRTGGGSSSSTRGLIFGGRGAPGNPHNEIQYIQFMTLGNALDFGDTIVNQRGQGCNLGSPIRGFCIANAPYGAGIEFVTIASKGNSTDFGDNIYGGGYQAGCSNSVRGVIAGGYQFPGSFLADQKSYITLASEGNAIEFGDLTEGGDDGLGYAYAAATAVRGVVLGGMDSSPSPSPSRTTVDAFNFDSKGEITVIGDLSQRKRDGACHSDSHGGLGGF